MASPKKSNSERPLTLSALKRSATDFLFYMNDDKSTPELYGVIDGKAVGTHVEHAFHDYLQKRFTYSSGSSASGIDFPELKVDLKVTYAKQPQSSCPFKSADQKVYGLGYHLIVFVYKKDDDHQSKTARLDFQHGVFIHKNQTGDYQTIRGVLDILEREGNIDDIIAFLEDRNLPLDEIGRKRLAERILKERPAQGYLTISNALQWRLQYGRVVSLAGQENTEGIDDLLGNSR